MKKGNKLIIVIVVLALLLVGCGGYICYDKYISKDNPSDVKKNEDTNDLSDNELNDLTPKFDEYNRWFGQYYPIDNMSKISNTDLFLFAISGVRKPDDEVFDVTAMKNYISKFFDDSIKLKNEDFKCLTDGKVLYKYDKGKNKYTEVIEGHMHGGSQRALPSAISTSIMDSKYEDGIYTITAKVLYGETCSDTCGPTDSYFKSYNDALEKKDAVVTGVNSITGEQMEEYKEKLPTTTYKFKKNKKGNMILVSVEVK